MRNSMICIVSGLLLQLVYPVWWWLMLVPFVVCFFMEKSAFSSFKIGVLSGFMLWFGESAILAFTGAEIIMERVSNMIGFPNDWLMLIVASLLMSVVSGISAVTGFYLKEAINGNKSIRVEA